MIRPLLSALLFASVAAPSLAEAQATVQAVPGTTTADRLAGEMRLLAGNANDLNALLAAGELSLQLEDLGAAASFFARAEKVDPRNGRAKAGQAAILVHAERPGEALRYFATAEADGLPAAAFASDRGLAYDLIGEQERAQRDYRLALRTAGTQNTDETLRRYALSLGISGRRDLAEQQLQPLLRKQDRGAWRTRAFVEAMTGNIAEANHIATTMMPPGTAAGLQPFFVRLAALGPIDRAFAVHFGEVRATPQRVADARLAPPLPTLGPDPYAPRGVALAAATTAPVVDKGKRKGRKGRQPVEVAATTRPPTPATPSVPAYGAPTPAPAVVARAAQPSPAMPAPVRPAASPSRPVMLAAVPMTPVRPTPAPATAALPLPPPERDVRVAATAPSTNAVVPLRPAPASVPASAPIQVAAAPATTPAPRAVTVTPASAAVAPTVVPVPASSPPIVLAAAEPTRRDTSPPATIQPMPPATAPSAEASPPARPAARVASSVAAPRRDALASIVGSLPIPAAELGIEAPRRAEPVPVAPTPTVEAPPPLDPAEVAAAERATAAKALAEKKAADRKAAAQKKALAEKKAAAEEKAEEAREAAAQKKLERANPERIWVQVAGGAYEGDLPKAWAAAKKKGGDVFAGHATGYTTPLRFTNRVLAGPFKTDEEARSFVNKLKAKGLSGFTFTSDAGQVVKKLGADE